MKAVAAWKARILVDVATELLQTDGAAAKLLASLQYLQYRFAFSFACGIFIFPSQTLIALRFVGFESPCEHAVVVGGEVKTSFPADGIIVTTMWAISMRTYPASEHPSDTAEGIFNLV